MKRPIKNIFTTGHITPGFISESIAKHSSNTSIGAHSIFLGQVRKDTINGNQVAAIDYTAYEEMALDKMHDIREATFNKYTLTCMHVHHSLGIVDAGQICLFVFVSAPHRRAAMEACEEVVEKIKAELPIWGKEVFEDESYQWKENK